MSLLVVKRDGCFAHAGAIAGGSLSSEGGAAVDPGQDVLLALIYVNGSLAGRSTCAPTSTDRTADRCGRARWWWLPEHWPLWGARAEEIASEEGELALDGHDGQSGQQQGDSKSTCHT